MSIKKQEIVVFLLKLAKLWITLVAEVSKHWIILVAEVTILTIGVRFVV